jgi:prevent-host-death family protein
MKLGDDMEWNLADAKNRFSEVVNRALTEGPQRVRRRKDAVVVVAAAEFERLAGQRPSFKKYLEQGVSFEGLRLERDRSVGRDVAL